MERNSAGFWTRVTAFGIDYLVIVAYAAILFLVTRLFSTADTNQVAAQVFQNPALFDLFAFLTLVLQVALYFALCECSMYQATWGKKRLRLCVTTLDGRRISLPRSLARSGMKFLPWQIAHSSLFHIPGWPTAVQQIPPGALAGFGIAWLLVGSYLVLLAFSASHRTLYDRLARTIVVRSKR